MGWGGSEEEISVCGPVKIFFLVTFGLGFLFQLFAVFSPIWLVAAMWTPALGAVLQLKAEGVLRPRPFREDWPGIAKLYATTAPAAFWLTLSVVAAMFTVGLSPRQPAFAAALTGVPEWAIFAVVVATAPLAPPINAFIATFGEEFGWRGYLLPKLARRMGWIWASAAVGVIWGAWHAPAVLVLGYNYGRPWCLERLLAFVLLTIPMSLIHTWAYLRCGVWGAAFLHGAVNGWANIYFLLYAHTFGNLAWSLTGLYGLATLSATAAVFWTFFKPRAQRPGSSVQGEEKPPPSTPVSRALA